MKKVSLLTASVLVLAGCSSMSEQECASANWYDIGYESAIGGCLKSANERDFNSCAKHDMPANIGQYDQGYEFGLRQFCTAENGARWGSAGKPYYNQCKGSSHEWFINEYKPAFALASAEADLRDAQTALQRSDNRLAALPAEIIKAQSDVDFFERSKFHLEQLQSLQAEQSRLQDGRPSLVAAIQQAKSSVNSVKACDEPFASGLDDALSGQPASIVSQRSQSCRGFARTLNTTQFLQGYDQGLQRFCTDRQADLLAREGRNYFGQCDQNNNDFDRLYRIAKYDQSLIDRLDDAQAKLLAEQILLSTRFERVAEILDEIAAQDDLAQIELLREQLNAEQDLIAIQTDVVQRAQQARDDSQLQANRFNQCRLGDWYTLGLIDGDAGKGYSALREYQQNCSQFGLTVDVSAYRSGLQESLSRYCTPNNAFLKGKAGEAVTPNCPANQRLEYQRAYQDGVQYASLLSNQTTLQQQEVEVVNAIRVITKSIQTQQQLFVSETDPVKRANIERKLLTLNSQLTTKQSLQKSLQRELQVFAQQILRIETQYPVVVL